MAKFIGAVPNFFRLIKNNRSTVIDDNAKMVSTRTKLIIDSFFIRRAKGGTITLA